MKTISIYNFKGGTGKTSLSFLLGNFLSMNGKKVLLIDSDPQSSLTKSFPKLEGNTIYDFLSENAELKDCIHAINDKLSLIPGSFKTLKIHNNVLQEFLKENLKGLKFDYCIIDTSPTLNSLVVSCLTASNLVLIPSLISGYDLNETLFILARVKEINSNAKTKVILNRTQKASGGFTKLEEEYKEALKVNGSLLKVSIPNTNLVKKFIDLKENPFMGKTKSKIAFTELFQAITEEIK